MPEVTRGGGGGLLKTKVTFRIIRAIMRWSEVKLDVVLRPPGVCLRAE